MQNQNKGMKSLEELKEKEAKSINGGGIVEVLEFLVSLADLHQWGYEYAKRRFENAKNR